MNLLDLFLKSTGVSTDTRQIKPGNIFFALKGPSFDGNRFAKSALDAGAVHVVSDDKKNADLPDCTIVDNTLSSLQTLATAYRNHLGLPIIGLTGSNGKTTTKEILGTILSQKYNCFNTRGNLNNHIGVPLSLLSIASDCEIAVIEMGANHVGEIKVLSDITIPDYGIITNIGLAHLEGFGSKDGIARGKFELFEHCMNYNHPVCYFADAYRIKEQLKSYNRIIELGHESIDVFGKSIEISPLQYTPVIEISLKYEDQEVIIHSNLSGAYNYDNLCLAIATAIYYDCSIDQIKKGIESYRPGDNRSQWTEWQGIPLFKDAYNANPTSMSGALNNFHLQCQGEHMILIIGDMKELGEYAIVEHKKIIDQVSSLSGDKSILLYGEEWHKLNLGSDMALYTDKGKIKEALNKLIKIGKCKIFVKGSRSNQLEQIFT